MENFDAIIIGTGQAGPSMAARCASEGLKTAIVERDKFGGTCVNTGCTPTKAMVASARAAHMARRGSDFGVDIESVRIDMKQVKARKDALVKQSTEGIEEWLKNTENLTVIEGHARFLNNHTLSVNGEEIKADKIFINTGARAFVPLGFEDADYLTNSGMMELDELPEHLVIIGGSYVGLEFGQIFKRFGSDVTIIEKGPHVIGKEDEETSEAIRAILEEEGITFRLNAECLGATSEKNGSVVVDLDCKEGAPKITGSHLLLAAGRIPNTDDLGIEHTGIEIDERGYIQTDDVLKTGVPGIWALGDCNGKGAFTHTSYNDFEIAAANLFDNDPRKVSDRILCYALYIDPALGRIGMNEQQARESDRDVLVGYREMARIARAKEKGETTGFMKILVDADTERILGATVFGAEGDEIIHSLLDVMYADQPYTVIQRAVHIHPTISELIPTVLGDLKPLD